MLGKFGRRAKWGRVREYRLRSRIRLSGKISACDFSPHASFQAPLYACLKRKTFQGDKARWSVSVYVVLVSKANPRIALWLLIKSHRAMVAFWKFWVSITHAPNPRRFTSRKIAPFTG